MRTTERSLFLLIALGFTLDAFRIPFAGVTYTLGFVALALFYLFGGVRLLPTPDRHHQVLPLSIVGGMALGLSVSALLFKVQLWPGSQAQAGVAALLGMGCVVAALSLGEARPHLAPYFRSTLLRLLPALGVAIFLLVQGQWRS